MAWVVLPAGLCPAAGAEPVERPFAVSVTVEGTGERVRGRVIEADAAGVVVDAAGEERALRWEQLDGESLMFAKGRVLARDDGRGWIDAAWLLAQRGGSAVPVDAALQRAVRVEPALAEEATAVRRGEGPSWYVESVVAEPEPPAEAAEEPAVADDPEGAAVPGEDGGGAGVPETVGDVQLDRWGEVSPELMRTGLEEQEAWLAEGMERTRLRLDVYRSASKHFLLATDLRSSEANRWARELDRMYEVMCGMFELPAEEELFLGKALIVIFRDNDDYHRWNAGTLGDPMLGTLGVCASFGDGHVRISFFRQRDTDAFARLLVHETTHGFLHRYRSPGRIPSWLNEGLAEVVAHRLFPAGVDFGQLRRFAARFSRAALSNPSSFFDAQNIPGPYYPVAYYFAEYLLAQDGERFRSLMEAIKDGKDPAAAVAEDYGVPGPRLLSLFAAEMNR